MLHDGTLEMFSYSLNGPDISGKLARNTNSMRSKAKDGHLHDKHFDYYG